MLARAASAFPPIDVYVNTHVFPSHRDQKLAVMQQACRPIRCEEQREGEMETDARGTADKSVSVVERASPPMPSAESVFRSLVPEFTLHILHSGIQRKKFFRRKEGNISWRRSDDGFLSETGSVQMVFAID